eukprot:3958438-Prymnesium_polylepis.1
MEVDELRAQLDEAHAQLAAERDGRSADWEAQVEEARRKQEEDKARRVAAMQGKVARRLQNQGIVRGWTAWHELFLEGVRHRQLLRGASSRLMRPQLSSTFHFWKLSALDAERDASLSTFEKTQAAMAHATARNA